jgi:thiamine biosynthesis lipoprotein
MKRLVIGQIFLALIGIVVLAGCSDDGPARESATVFAMDTVMFVTVYGEEAGEAVRLLTGELHRLDRLFSVTLAESDIARINAARGETVTVSEETAEVLGLALGLWEETGGRFSPGLYALQRAWGFTAEENRVPGKEEIRALLAYVDVGEIRLEGLAVTVPAGMELDLGAIAKGYAADRLVGLGAGLGGVGALPPLGGDVLARGGRFGGEAPWRIGVRDPLGAGYLGILELRDAAVNTSGNYQRRFVGEDGQVYHHILDPLTGRPAMSGLASVTAVTPEGARGDALSTGLFVMGLEAGLAFVERTADLEAIFVTEDGWVYVTEGLRGVFAPEEEGRVRWG